MQPFTEQQIRDFADDEIKQKLGGEFFTLRKTTDTPPDSLSLVSRGYVTKNGPSTTRPQGSVIGQFYLDTTLASGRGKPIYWNGTGWVDATGTYV